MKCTASSHLVPVWSTVTDLQVVSGSACTVVTTDGREYLDFTAGVATTSTGHCHPHVVAAIREQAGRFVHAQVNCYRHPLLESLAARLCDVTPAGIDRFFFSNSGAEATEAAVKLAKQATGKPNVIVFTGSFHGRTHLTMAMTTSRAVYRAGHAPLPSGIFVSPFPDVLHSRLEPGDEVDRCLEAFAQLLQCQTSAQETACIVLEPVLGEGGYVPSPPGFIRGIARMCADKDILFVADEVQTGFGRTGRFFAIEHYGVHPDIMVMAKGIASGFPISAVGCRHELAERWPPGSHGGTYGGNPIACAAALATLDVIGAEGFLGAVRERASTLLEGLCRLGEGRDEIVDVRGLGLMIATEFREPAAAAAVLGACLDEGLILMSAGATGATIRWMPPLVVTDAEVRAALGIFTRAVEGLA